MSAGFELATGGSLNMFDTAITEAKPIADLKPGTFEGTGKAVGMGIMRGGAAVARAAHLATGVIPLAIDKLTGGTDEGDKHFAEHDRIFGNAVDYWTPRPNEVGAAGRILGGVSEMALPLMAGGGNPSLLVGSAGLGAGEELVKQGVDAGTARDVAIVQAGATAVGFKIPFLGSTLARKVAFGAASNPVMGAGAAGLSASILEHAGYKKEAAQFDPWDVEARMTELLMGAVFGGVAHAFNPKGERLFTPAAPDHPVSRFFADLLPSQRDAVLTANNAKHIDVDTAPGRPLTHDAKNQHYDALQQALDDANAGKNTTASVDPKEFAPVPRRDALRDAVRMAVDQERGRPIPETLPAASRRHIDSSDLQPEAKGRLHELFYEAAARKPGFDRMVLEVADAVGGVAKLAELKGVERTVDKVRDDYRGDPNQMKDLLRATVQVNDAQAALAAVEALQARFNVMERGRRNLLDPALQPVDGYRDAKLNVLIDGHVAEVQVNLPGMLDAKKAAHPHYEARETIYRKAEAAGRDLTAAEQARVDKLNAQMRAIYDPVWAEATNSLNASSEIGAPLRSAEADGNLRGGDTSQAAQNSPGTPAPRDTGMPSTSKNSARGGNDIDANSTAGEARSITDTSSEIISQAEISAADAAIKANPDLQVTLEDGTTMKASDALARADEDIAQAQQDSKGFEAAINCYLRKP